MGKNKKASVPPRLLAQMEADWDARAREAANYYVATGRRDWTEEEFFRGGEINVENEILSDAEIWRGKVARQMRILEIGCGVGRMTKALAAKFGEVHAVDVSSEMLAAAARNLAGLQNVRLYKTSGSELAALPSSQFDFAFSFIVFQHIPSTAVIENYVREVHRCLKPGSVFKFQVQGDIRLAQREPDTWEGAPIALDEARALAARCGFELIRALGNGTQYFWLWFLKPPAPDRHPARAALRGWWRRARNAMTRPAAVSFRPPVVRPMDEYVVTIPAFRGKSIDVEYELTTPGEPAPKCGVVAHWVDLDARGRARVQVPAEHPRGAVRIVRIRSRADGQWRAARGSIEVLGRDA